MTPDRFILFARVGEALTRAPAGHFITVSDHDVADVLPHYWREEANSVAEWFIRYCRAYGLYAVHDRLGRHYLVRRTRDIADEATITWPGDRRRAAAGEEGTK